ncbi:hypothetical protein DFQ26_006743 [Actinomortierella ambigua]|nr:hypothetical protein DFQ26_006743 [Actinomortierella ambigua]
MGLLVLASSVFADVKYTVVAFTKNPANRVAVEVKGNTHYLQTTKDLPYIWTTTVRGVSSSNSYRYVEFDRKNKMVDREKNKRYPKGSFKTATPNDFFGRNETFIAVPKLEQIYKDVRPKPSKVFDNRQVATIHFNVDPAEFDHMMQNPRDRDIKIKANLTFVNADLIHSSDNVRLSISGNSSRKRQKVSLKVKFPKTLPKGDPFFDRPILKLRAGAADPTVMREMLYVDVLNAVGIHASETSWVRAYVNGKPQGFFLMMEDIEEPFVMNTIHRGAISNVTELGSLYQMGKAEAPMIYQGPNAKDYNSNVYETKVAGPGDKDMVKWIAFMKDLRDFKSSDRDAVAFWSKRLELDSFLRAMAVDYLAGAWDSFWARGHNYFMYLHPQTNLWQFLPSDFDHSFNDDKRPNPDLPYREWTPKQGSQGFTGRPLVTKLIIENKAINKMFETIVLRITDKVFNREALYPLIDAHTKRIANEVDWDVKIDRSHLPGNPFKRSMKHFYVDIGEDTPKYSGGQVLGIKPYVKWRANYVRANVGK